MASFFSTCCIAAVEQLGLDGKKDDFGAMPEVSAHNEEALSFASKEGAKVVVEDEDLTEKEPEAVMPEPPPPAPVEENAKSKWAYNPNGPVPNEARLCPISGMRGLEGVCPFAKPKKKAKSGSKPPPMKLEAEMEYETEGKYVHVSVKPYPKHAFDVMELPDTATAEQIKRQYKVLAMKHHPDKNLDDTEAAAERFEVLKDAYQVLKETNGEMAFPWDDPDGLQQVMEPSSSITVFARYGNEALMEDPLKSQALRHMVKVSDEVKVLLKERDDDDVELFALITDNKNGCLHIVKIRRMKAKPLQELPPGTEPQGL